MLTFETGSVGIESEAKAVAILNKRSDGQKCLHLSRFEQMCPNMKFSYCAYLLGGINRKDTFNGVFIWTDRIHVTLADET